MTPPQAPAIAVIGASLTGLVLTLSLLKSSVTTPANITIFERLPPNVTDAAHQSGIILTPNGLGVLDHLGVLARIRHLCWKSEYRTYRNDADELVRKVRIAEGMRYANHRLWRRLLLSTLKDMVRESGVHITYDAKFECVSAEDDAGVTFVVNGVEHTASMLFGCDGIYSTVRRSLSAVGPEYTGVLGVLAHIPWSAVEWPFPEYERACTIQGKAGAVFWIAEDAEGKEVMVGRQVSMPDMEREEWERLAGDRDALVEFYRRGYEDWGATARKVIDAVSEYRDTLFCWPFLRMAKLDRWYSEGGRVVILGDAAHALPPSSGQGFNQTCEDCYVLTKLLEGKGSLALALAPVLEFWQQTRQERIDAVFDWATSGTNVQRLPKEDREKLIAQGQAKSTEAVDDMRWLYEPDLDETVEAWLRRSNS